MAVIQPAPDQGKLYLDDLHVGQAFVSAVQVVDGDQIKAFARQFDPQPFHLDDEAAKSTIFAGLAASGWHTAAITMKLLVESVPLAGGNHRRRERDFLAQTGATGRCAARREQSGGDNAVAVPAGSRNGGHAQRDAQPARRSGPILTAKLVVARRWAA